MDAAVSTESLVDLEMATDKRISLLRSELRAADRNQRPSAVGTGCMGRVIETHGRKNETSPTVCCKRTCEECRVSAF